MATTKAPVEGKVWAATAGGTAGYVISQFILWVLGVTLWGISTDALSAKEAVLAVPDPVNGLIGLGITVGGVFIGGWFAKHTPRPEGLYSPKRELTEDAEPKWDEDTAAETSVYPVPEYPGPDVIPTEEENK